MIASVPADQQIQNEALESYRAAIRNVAFYAIELDREITAGYRQSLSSLEQSADGAPAELFASLLREYRGAVTEYAGRLTGELAQAAASLGQLLDGLSDGDADYDNRMRSALGRLRAFAQSPEAAEIRDRMLAAAGAVGDALDEMRKRQEGSVAELMEQIHNLHKRIDALESSASLDTLTKLLSRAEMEQRTHSGGDRDSRAWLIAAGGLKLAETRFDQQVAAQLAAAFLKRLYRVLPAGSILGRWTEDEFMVIVPGTPGAPALEQPVLEQQLSGSYACSQDGKSIRPSLQVRIAPYTAAAPV